MRHHHLFGRRKVIVLIAGAIALHACAESPVAPASKAPPPRPLKSVSYIDPYTSAITVVDDDDGTQYTLNPATNEIQVSDGSFIELDPALTATFAAAFEGTVETDQIIPSMSNLSLDCTPYELPGKDGRGCQEEQVVTSPGAQLGTARSGVKPKRNATTAATILWRRASSVSAVGSAFDGRPAMHTSVDQVFALDFGDPCVDVLNSVAPNISVFSQQRTSFLQTIRDIVGGELVSRGGEWAFERTLTSGSGAAAAVLTKLADAASARVSVSILAYVWNTNSCGTHVPVAQVTLGGTGGGGSGGSGGLVCHLEGWEISFDGGNTWSPITVKVCQYAME